MEHAVETPQKTAHEGRAARPSPVCGGVQADLRQQPFLCSAFWRIYSRSGAGASKEYQKTFPERKNRRGTGNLKIRKNQS